MATIDDIKINLQRLVPRLNTSASSLWTRICEVFAYFIDIVRLEIRRSELTIAQRTRATRITTRNFYIEKALYFQEGDSLEVIDSVTQELGYSVLDESKRIIKQASIIKTTVGSAILNVATADGDKNLTRLSQAQIDAFRSYYINFIGFGAQFEIASSEPAIWNARRLYVRYYSTSNLDSVRSLIYDALHDLQLQLRSNGVVYVNEIEAYLTNLDGIRDAYFSDIYLDYDGGRIEPDDGTILLTPGFFNFNPALYDWNRGPAEEENVTIFEVET